LTGVSRLGGSLKPEGLGDGPIGQKGHRTNQMWKYAAELAIM